MELIITKPDRKKDYYMGRVLTTNRKPIQVILQDVKWLRTIETRDQNQVLRISMPISCESQRIIEELDAKVFRICLENNEKWFHNALTEDKLRTFFRPSIDPVHSSMGILCNIWAEPMIYVDGQLVETLKSLHVSKDAHVKMIIEAQGVIFQKTLFGIRWMLRKCWIESPDNPILEVARPFEDERATIEHYWEEEVEKYVGDLEQQVAHIRQRMDDIRKELDLAKQTTSEIEWNALLKNISKTIFQRESALERSQR